MLATWEGEFYIYTYAQKSTQNPLRGISSWKALGSFSLRIHLLTRQSPRVSFFHHLGAALQTCLIWNRECSVSTVPPDANSGGAQNDCLKTSLLDSYSVFLLCSIVASPTRTPHSPWLLREHKVILSACQEAGPGGNLVYPAVGLAPWQLFDKTREGCPEKIVGSSWAKLLEFSSVSF